MHDHLHQYLEGERPGESLPPDLRHAAAAWDRLLDVAREEEGVPPWLEGRVWHALVTQGERSGLRRALRAWFAPRTVSVRVRPAVAVALGCAIVAVVVWRTLPTPPVPVAEAPTSVGPVMVQFAFEAPQAERVAVAGSFNAWRPDATPLSDPDGDGVWTAMVPLLPGVHQYMFVVDGVEWVADPRAERVVEDGFGRNNAVLAVGLHDSRAL